MCVYWGGHIGWNLVFGLLSVLLIGHWVYKVIMELNLLRKYSKFQVVFFERP